MNTPYFNPWRSRLAALGRRTTQTVRQATLAQLQQHLRDFLPAPLLSPEEEGANSRDRVFSLRLTLECFLWQLLKPKTSCREVVRQVQALFRLHGRGPVDEGDSAYVQARQRLPAERLEKALKATAQAADRRVGQGGQLRERPVKVVDGSTTQLPDTWKNQKRYPQPASQKPGCGFPVMKLVVLFSLSSGAILNVILGSLHHHDLRLLHGLWDQLKKGDILLGDRAFGEYTTLAGLPQQGVDVVARLHHRRKVDFRKAQRLGKNDARFVWTKGCQQSEILCATQWRLLPQQITVRIIRFAATIRGFRSRHITLVTTLLDPKLFPAQELVGLYARRWRLELCLRDLKTMMGMEALRCKTPDMAEKELLAYLVAHNLIRCLIAEAVARYQVDLERVSFKGSVDALRQYSDAMAKARNQKMRQQLWEDLLLNLARDLCATDPTESSLVPSSAGPSLSHFSINHATASKKSPTATATGKDAPAIFEVLTKGHSSLTPLRNTSKVTSDPFSFQAASGSNSAHSGERFLDDARLGKDLEGVSKVPFKPFRCCRRSSSGFTILLSAREFIGATQRADGFVGALTGSAAPHFGTSGSESRSASLRHFSD